MLGLTLTTFALLTLGPAVSTAIPIQGYVQPNEHLSHIDELRPSTRVTLDHGAQSAYVLKSGNFSFPEVSPGLHTLQVLCSSHRFPEFAIVIPSTSSTVDPSIPSAIPSSATLESDAQIDPSPSSTSQAPFILIQSPSHHLPFDPTSPPPIGSLPHPIELLAVTKNDFYTSPGSFQAFDMLKNPMMLLMVGSAALMFFMPKLLAAMDPDAIEEANKMLVGIKTQSTPDITSPAVEDVVGLAEEKVQAVSSSPAAGGAGGKKKVGNKKKR